MSEQEKMHEGARYSVENGDQMDFHLRQYLAGIVQEARQIDPKSSEVRVGRVEVQGGTTAKYEVIVRRV
ncbi:hypothetical protein [Methylobacterium nodulans]|uniref:Uncharacterized protein n=1 Tax=Methylobacterium nodulans (strain LMG 21967 / CNCM I-2342 / ORS 2060) TaxID=460265 RepID=B8I9W9_METNO|nr:hypothetical protein [Methylobacterium nodulans]ACL57197.1 hypothetical protein Mnod_2217 [Methylobacterium nodulans ORS 2060]